MTAVFRKLVLAVVLGSGWWSGVAGADEAKNDKAAPSVAAPSREGSSAAESDIGAEPSGFSFAFGTAISDAVAKFSNQRLLDRLVRPESMAYDLAPLVWLIANDAVGLSQWSGTVRVNMPPVNEPGINIYIVKRSFLTANRFSGLQAVCPCEYLVGTTSIVCVEDALKRAIDSLGVSHAGKPAAQGTMAGKTADGAAPAADPPAAASDGKAAGIDDDTALQAVRPYYRDFMSRWIIAHEIGHLVLGHTFDDLRRSWSFANSSVGLDAERQADLFYLNHLQNQEGPQGAAFMALSNLMTTQYRAALIAENGQDKVASGEVRVFSADHPVTLAVSPSEHPPMLLRAVNLFKALLARYPNMMDSSGYVERITEHLKFAQAAHSTVPEFCRIPEAEERSPEPLRTLALYADLHVYEGNEDWARTLLDRAQAQLADTTVPQAEGGLWRVLLAVELAKIDWKFRKTAPDWDKLTALAAGLDAPHRNYAELQFERLRSFVGAREVKDAAAAARAAEDRVKGMVERNEFALNNDGDVHDLLTTYQEIAFSPVGEFTEGSMALLEHIGAEVGKLQNVGGLRRQHFMAMLDAQAHAVLAQGPAHKVATERYISMLVDVASNFDRLVDEVRYRLEDLHFVKTNFSDNHQLIVDRDIAVARSLVPLELLPQAMDFVTDAGAQLAAIDVNTLPEDKRATYQEWSLVMQNDIGWFLVLGHRFAEAEPILDKVRLAREGARAADAPCTSKDQLVPIYQNLADTELGLGAYARAIDFAEKARRCLADERRSRKTLELIRTEGFAELMLGHEENAKTLLSNYVAGLFLLLDDAVVDRRLLVANVGGKPMKVDDVVDVGKVVADTREKFFSPKRIEEQK